ncbi:MAG: hypothetical protein WCS96_06570, partial [Victivallales bacterium]
GFSYPRKSNSSGGLESPPSVSFESAQGSFEITSSNKTQNKQFFIFYLSTNSINERSLLNTYKCMDSRPTGQAFFRPLITLINRYPLQRTPLSQHDNQSKISSPANAQVIFNEP